MYSTEDFRRPARIAGFCIHVWLHPRLGSPRWRRSRS
jgi:hypothetical protein